MEDLEEFKHHEEAYIHSESLESLKKALEKATSLIGSFEGRYVYQIGEERFAALKKSQVKSRLRKGEAVTLMTTAKIDDIIKVSKKTHLPGFLNYSKPNDYDVRRAKLLVHTLGGFKKIDKIQTLTQKYNVSLSNLDFSKIPVETIPRHGPKITYTRKNSEETKLSAYSSQASEKSSKKRGLKRIIKGLFAKEHKSPVSETAPDDDQFQLPSHSISLSETSMSFSEPSRTPSDSMPNSSTTESLSSDDSSQISKKQKVKKKIEGLFSRRPHRERNSSKNLINQEIDRLKLLLNCQLVDNDDLLEKLEQEMAKPGAKVSPESRKLKSELEREIEINSLLLDSLEAPLKVEEELALKQLLALEFISPTSPSRLTKADNSRFIEDTPFLDLDKALIKGNLTDKLYQDLHQYSAFLFKSIDHREFNKIAIKQGDHAYRPNLIAQQNIFQQVKNVFGNSIIHSTNLAEAQAKAQVLLELMEKAYGEGDLQLGNILASTLSSSPIYRLMTPKQKEIYEAYTPLADTRPSNKKIKEIVNTIPGVIPNVGTALSNLTFINDGNPDTKEVDNGNGVMVKMPNVKKLEFLGGVALDLMENQRKVPTPTQPPATGIIRLLTDPNQPEFDEKLAYEISERLKPPES